MTFLERIISSFKRRASDATPPPVPDSSFVPVLPTEDAREADTSIDQEPPVADLISELVAISYCDANGNESERRITIRRIWDRDGYLYVGAYCHERKGARTFRADRMMQIVDMSSGEVFDDGEAFFRQHALFDSSAGPAMKRATMKGLKNVRAELVILTFIGHCDGYFDEDERDIVIDYVCRRIGEDIVDRPLVFKRVCRLFPDDEMFYESLERLTDLPDEEIVELVHTVARVVEADGILDEAEAIFVNELHSILVADGWNIQVEIVEP